MSDSEQAMWLKVVNGQRLREVVSKSEIEGDIEQCNGWN